MEGKDVIAVVSDGMDSITLAYLLPNEGYYIHLISIDYGQRHVRERGYARPRVQRLEAKFGVVNISRVRRLLKGSALKDDSPCHMGTMRL